MGVTPNQGVLSWPARVRNYIDELKTEMKRVTWPSWQQVRATTIAVIITTFIFAAYFAIIDYVFGKLIDRIYDFFLT